MPFFHWICFGVAIALFVGGLVGGSNASMNINWSNCSASSVSSTYFFKGAPVSEVTLSSGCQSGLAGFENSNGIFLNANENGLSKAMVLRHEYCHWLKADADSFEEEVECNVAELNPFNYV